MPFVQVFSRFTQAPASRRRVVRQTFVLAAAARLACPAAAQNLGQDELDLQGRSSVVQGSGARAFGMGGAFLARPDDATAASWNPAGLSYLRRPEVSAVRLGSSTLLNREFPPGSTDPTLYDRRTGDGFDFFAATYPLSLSGVSGAVQVSYQRVLPFDSRRNIERPRSRVDVVSSGGFDVLGFGTGLQVSRRWRVGATLNRWLNGYEQTLDRQGAVTTHQTLRFDLAGWNVNLGAIWSPVESLNLGAVIKTPFNAAVRIDRTRADTVEGGELTNQAVSPNVRLRLPGAVGVGVSWRPRSTLTLSADYTRSFWSGARIYNYFTLPVQGAPLANDVLAWPALGEAQSDTQEVRFGVERVLLFERAKVPVRAGVFSDRQYFLLPDGTAPHSLGWTLGAGVVIGPLLLDAAYVREHLRYSNQQPAAANVRRVIFVSGRAYFSLIFRLP
jgi:hypothetical protein